MVLPPSEHRATAATATTWLIGAQPTAPAKKIARRFGARPAGPVGTYVITRTQARRFARALREQRLLRYAEPDVAFERRSSFDGHLDAWARAAVVPPAQAAPDARGVTVAIIDDFVDPGHPDVGPSTQYLNRGSGTVEGAHGTQVASAAAGAAGNGGVTGVLPGARILSYGLSDLSCSNVARGVTSASRAEATVINLSLGGERDCFTLFRAVSLAYAAGSVVIAAGGNEYLEGNPISYPAAYPHVLSVSALDTDLLSTGFSNANTAIDLAAPGADVPVAVPMAFDDDGTADGTTTADGTSFAAPIVAGAAAWLKAVRPTLTNGQIADVLRRSATDVDELGYDQNTGYGLVNVAAALSEPAPRIDPLEPNDGITFVDGTVFGRADPFVWRGTGVRQLRGSTVDQVEDPVDVYRIRVPARTAIKVLMTPSAGDPDMALYSGAAETISDRREIVDQSLRGPRRAESVSGVNRARRAVVAYVVVTVDTRLSQQLDAAYRLDFLRIRRR